MTAVPVTVSLWAPQDGGVRKVGEIDTATSYDFEARLNQVGPWSMTMPYNEQALKVTEKHLVSFDFRNTQFVGVIESFEPFVDERGKVMLRVSGLDALTLLGDVLCWPVPAASLNNQTQRRYRATGNAETVLRSLIVANMVTRRGDPISVAPSEGRGGRVSLSERFSNLLEVVTRKCRVAGLRVSVRIVTEPGATTRGQLRVFFAAPSTTTQRRVILSPDLGTVARWTQTSQTPGATRAIVGGPGAGTNRVFRLVAPGSTFALTATQENTWGRRREVFVDARNAEDTQDAGGGSWLSWPGQLENELDEAGVEAVLAAASSTAFTIEAVEAEGMRYGTHFDVGDLVTVQLLPEVSKVVALGAVQVAVTPSEGLRVQLVPGNPDSTDPLLGQARLITGIRRHVAALQREEN